MANNTIAINDVEKIYGNVTWPRDDALNTSWTPTPAVSADAKPFETVILVAIILGILLVTLLLFSMAVFIDCRHQRLEAENGSPKRISPKKSRIPVFIANAGANTDELAFVNEMCNENRVTTPASEMSGENRLTTPVSEMSGENRLTTPASEMCSENRGRSCITSEEEMN